MKFVEMQDDTRYESLELRLRVPDDENLFVVLKSSRINFDNQMGEVQDLELHPVYERMMRDCHQMRNSNFDCSVWKVSRQNICEPITNGLPKKGRK